MKSDNPYILAGAADTALRELRKLARHDDPAIRRRVAEHPRVPLRLLVELSADGDADVRIAVSESPRLPESVLERLAEDCCDDVRYALAENLNLPMSILSRLADDDNPFVSQRSIVSLKRLQPCSVAGLDQDPERAALSG
ncbi:MAG: hypothetical protein IPM23_09290 [Candidatus Melainabacteria bacterium]|nr:hypothetical protein [Candidatus Melainabacteria bacterium]